jgi:predicted DNA-binding transcriptional regulator AlpA
VEMHKQIKGDENRIQFDNRGNLNGSTVPSLVLEMKRERSDEWARRVYEIYCDVWRKQGKMRSAAFVRAVCDRAVLPTLRARTNGIIGEFTAWATRTSFPSAIRDASLRALRLEMGRLEDHWRRRLEIEAKECEHGDKANGLPAQGQGVLPSTTTVREVSGNEQWVLREAIVKKVKNPQAHRFLTIPEAALYFGVQPRTIYRWTNERGLSSGPRRGSVTIDSILKWEKRRARKPRQS